MEKKQRRAVVDARLCAACGCCVKVCPRGAIQVERGVTARVDETCCAGCGLCAVECPASVIIMREVQA